MEIRIATFNIYWFPSSSFAGNRRTSGDLGKLREVIKRLDSDVLVFQEILDLESLEDLLSGVIQGRTYSLRDQAGGWAASGVGQEGGMKVPVAFDSSRLQLLEAGSARNAEDPPPSKGRRDPVAARLKPLDGGVPFTVIGVHLKSGSLTVGPDPSTEEDEARVREMDRLARWIRSSSAITQGEPAVLLGDFNALQRNAALAPLAPGGELSSWSWPEPRFAWSLAPAPVEADLPETERWTTHLDREVIDHVMLSPGVQVASGPWVYAFDHDRDWLEAAGISREWLEERSYTLAPDNGPVRNLENLHRISDHRPVRVSITLP